MENTIKTPLELACDKVNGPSRLAELLTAHGRRRVSKASISQWKGSRVPAEHCPDIEALTGVKCEELRPDINWAVLRNTGWDGKERRKVARGGAEKAGA